MTGKMVTVTLASLFFFTSIDVVSINMYFMDLFFVWIIIRVEVRANSFDEYPVVLIAPGIAPPNSPSSEIQNASEDGLRNSFTYHSSDTF